ncbi:MAG: hypothetical protein DDT27_01491 [Dehalococcoidia bacterium]|nr:hypothetical protein [Chloroflexota bacterium]
MTLGVLSHSDSIERFGDPLPYLPGGQTQIFRTEGHVVFHSHAYDLIIRILKYHPHPLAYLSGKTRIPGVHSIYPHVALGREEQCIKVFYEGGFPAAGRPDNRHILALFYLQANGFEHRGISPVVYVNQMFYFDHKRGVWSLESRVPHFPSCILYPVSCILHLVSCILYPVSCLSF